MTNIIIPSAPSDEKKIMDAIVEADNSLIRIDAEKDQIKAIMENLAEAFPDIDKKYFKKMLNVYHKQNFDATTTESENFTTLYQAIVA